MRTKNDLELEVILTSLYCDIVYKMIHSHGSLSVLKTLCFAFLSKKNKFLISEIFRVTNTKEVSYKALSMLNGHFKPFIKDLKFIFSAIHLLIINEKIFYESGILCVEQKSFIATNDSFLSLAINECRKMSDVQFLKEMLNNV